MNDRNKADAVRRQVLEALTRVAPELEPDTLDPQMNFRDQMDFDSMDFLNFVITLHKTFAIDIPETDYPKLFNLSGCVNYVLAGGKTPAFAAASQSPESAHPINPSR